MSVPARLAAFAAVLGLVFGAAAWAGAAIDPTQAPVRAGAGHGAPTHPASAHGAATGAAAAAAASGLAVSEGGYTLEAGDRLVEPGTPARFAFRITDERGRVVRDEFEVAHEKELHLIVVRRDTAAFQHLHPRKGEDGTWSTRLELPEPGVYRAYADFTIDGTQHTLATDLFVPGEFRPQRLPAPETGAAADGLDVALEADGARVGQEARLSFSVSRDGRPYEALEPYLGAKGHLVALRDGDLAYLHVHPAEGGDAHAHAGGDAGTGAHANEIPFAATFPSAGRYRLFLQFRAGGEVRTVAYTLEVPR